jgi:hypothetical protein
MVVIVMSRLRIGFQADAVTIIEPPQVDPNLSIVALWFARTIKYPIVPVGGAGESVKVNPPEPVMTTCDIE